MKVLQLTLNKKAFDVMVTGEKKNEYRKPTKWIQSRLMNKDGTMRKYDVVKFVNGYGKDKPQFVCEFKGADQLMGDLQPITFSNGLTVEVKRLDWDISLGKIGIKRNIK